MPIVIEPESNRKKQASISMAPMIDMVFLLLVFFMTASAMSQAGSKLELDLPESTGSEIAKDFSDRLMLSIDAEGSLFLGTEKVDSDGLVSAIEKFRENGGNPKLNIRAAKETPFSAIKAAMKTAADAGVDSYLYATYQAGES